MSTWKHDYLERAQHIIVMRNGGAQINTAMLLEDKLEDDIQGKLAIWQARDLLHFVMDIPGQASSLIMSLIPLEVADYMSED